MIPTSKTWNEWLVSSDQLHLRGIRISVSSDFQCWHMVKSLGCSRILAWGSQMKREGAIQSVFWNQSWNHMSKDPWTKKRTKRSTHQKEKTVHKLLSNSLSFFRSAAIPWNNPYKNLKRKIASQAYHFLQQRKRQTRGSPTSLGT